MDKTFVSKLFKKLTEFEHLKSYEINYNKKIFILKIYFNKKDCFQIGINFSEPKLYYIIYIWYERNFPKYKLSDKIFKTSLIITYRTFFLILDDINTILKEKSEINEQDIFNYFNKKTY